jgi:hypothetical protein
MMIWEGPFILLSPFEAAYFTDQPLALGWAVLGHDAVEAEALVASFASVGSLSEAYFPWVCPDGMHASMCSTLSAHCCHLILLTLTWSNEIWHSGSSSSTYSTFMSLL